MSHIIETVAYRFEELSDSAKERARQWWREFVFSDNNDWDHIYDDANRMAELMGIDISTSPVRLMGGGSRQKLDIYFSGFSSQGDGACFEGSYRYKKGAVKAIKSETGFGFKNQHGLVSKGDEELIRIATELQEVQRRNFYRLYATIKQSGHYHHSRCTSIEVEDSENRYRDLKGDDEVVTELLRDFMDWIYKQLEREYEWQSSDEQVDEAITINEYDFDEEGKRI
jgi:hypothetical protein